MAKHFYFDGCKVKDLGVNGHNRILVKVVADYAGRRQVGEEILVSPVNLHELVSTAFPLKSKVVSVLNARVVNFTGTVVGYELHSNKAICLSSRDEHDIKERVRYAYGINEINLRPSIKVIEFVPGKWYRFNENDESVYMAVESVFSPTEVMMFNNEGLIGYKDMPMLCATNLLEQRGIVAVECLN
jgi:hypothetical protein